MAESINNDNAKKRQEILEQMRDRSDNVAFPESPQPSAQTGTESDAKNNQATGIITPQTQHVQPKLRKPDLEAAIRNAMAGAAVPTAPDKGEWFAGRKDTSPNRLLPIEQHAMQTDDKEIRDILKHIAQDEQAASILEKQIHDILKYAQSPEFRKELESLSNQVRSLQSSLTPEEQARLSEELLAHIESGGDIESLMGSNALARIVSLHLHGVQSARMSHVRDLSQLKKMSESSTQAGAMWGITNMTLAVVTLLASVGVTKTGTEQGLDLIQTENLWGAGAVNLVTHMFEKLGYDVVSARNAAIFAIALTASGTASAVIMFGKAKWGALGAKARLFVILAGLYSAGFGLLGLNNKTIDATAISVTGAGVDKSMGPMKIKAAGAKKSIDELFTELERLTGAAVTAEMQKKAYAHRTALLHAALEGRHDEQRRLQGTATLTNPTASNQTHERFQSQLATLKAELKLNPDEGLRHLIQRYREQVRLDVAPKLIDAVVKMGKEAQESTFWWHLLTAIDPTSQTVTPSGMYKGAEAARDAFADLVKTYEEVRAKATADVSKYLDGIARIGGAGGGDMQQLKAQILAKLGGIGVTQAEIQGALAGIPKPEGKFVWVPDAQAWQSIQDSLNSTWIGKSGVDVVHSGWWATAYAATLLGVFGLLDYGTGVSSYYLNRYRRKRFAAEFPAQESATNEVESEVAIRTAAAVDAILARLNAISGDSPLHRPIPPLLVELHVRRELREQFIVQEGINPSGSAAAFVHGFVFGETPDYITMYERYREWIQERLSQLNSDPARTLQSLVTALYPKIEQAIAVAEQYESADLQQRASLLSQLRGESLEFRDQQLKNYAQVIHERLTFLGITEKAILDRMKPDEADKQHRPPVVRLDPSKDVIVSREIALETFMLADVRNEMSALRETQRELQELGIFPDRPSEVGAEETRVGPWKLAGRDAIADQLERARRARYERRRTVVGTAEDYQRFDEYMTTINQSLTGVDQVLESSPQLKDYTRVYEYRHDPSLGGYTIFIELYKDQYANPIASLSLGEIVPDFSDSPPETQAARILDWMKKGGDAERGLIVQASHGELCIQFTELMSEMGNIPIVNQGRSAARDGAIMDKAQRALNLAGIIASERPIMPLARQGARIEQTKFEMFINPDRRVSDTTAYANLESVFADVDTIDVPKSVSISYSPVTETLTITRKKGLRRSEEMTRSISIHTYKRDDLVRAISDISSS